MDGVIKHCFRNLRNEDVLEEALSFVTKMSRYQPDVSEAEVNHILPHARIEKFERETAIRRICGNSKISGEMKRRLINQAGWERSPHNGGNYYLITRLGEAIFGKSRFNIMLRA
jgi:hypothetical protein